MELDLEAATEAPRAISAMRISLQRENTANDIELEAVPNAEPLQAGEIRRRNTEQAGNPVRESITSSTDTEPTLIGDMNREKWNIIAYVKSWWRKRVRDGIKCRSGSLPPTDVNEEGLETDKEQNTYKERNWQELKTGIPKLVLWLLTHRHFMISRRFDESHMRILIHLQIEITAIERELHKRDDMDAAVEHTPEYCRLRGYLPHAEGTNVRYYNGELRSYEWHEDTLMSRLMTKVEQYDKFKLLYERIRALPRPPGHSHDSVANWVENKNPLCPDAREFIFNHNDFSSFDDRAGDSPFKSWIDSYFFKNPRSPLKPLFKTKGDNEISYYDERLISVVAHTMSLVVLTGMLLTPIYLLFLLELSRGLMTLVVSVFTILTYVVIAIGTPTSQFKAFVATVAYCAFLGQFLGNLGRGN